MSVRRSCHWPLNVDGFLNKVYKMASLKLIGLILTEVLGMPLSLSSSIDGRIALADLDFIHEYYCSENHILIGGFSLSLEY